MKKKSFVFNFVASFVLFFVIISVVIKKYLPELELDQDVVKQTKKLVRKGKKVAVSKRKTKVKAEDLTTRQQKILNLFTSKKNIEVAFIKKELGLNERTVRRDLTTLVDKKLIKKQGKTRGSKYILIQK